MAAEAFGLLVLGRGFDPVAGAEKRPAAFKSRKLYREQMVIGFSAEHRFNMMSEVAFEELDGERLY
jgi:hypothetical protein